MTQYLKKRFSVAVGGKAFSEGWDRIFGKPASEGQGDVSEGEADQSLTGRRESPSGPDCGMT